MDPLVSPQLEALVPLAPSTAAPDAAVYHPVLWFCFWIVAWGLLGHFILAVYASALDCLWSLHRRLMQLRGSKRKPDRAEGVLHGGADQHAWGQRLLLAYGTLTASKQAYMRRLLRSFIYYTGAVIAGFWFLLTHFHQPSDMYTVYTPAMEIAFCAAAAHFLYCCIEDWPCRSHMGRTRREQLVVFGGYIVHHLLTAAAYLMAVRSGELGSMCAMGLTFEGPVLFACLRELVALYDEDFDLFDKVPPVVLKINWMLAFGSLLPCRYVSIGFFLYSAVYWQPLLAQVSLEMQLAYWGFGLLFLFINAYFTWLLTFWYRQDQRYLRKKRARQAEQRRGDGHSQAQGQALGQGQGQGQAASPASSASSSSSPYSQAVQRPTQAHQHQHQMHDPLAVTAAGSAAATVAAPLSRPLSPLLHPHGDGHAVSRGSGFAGHEVAAAATTQRHAAAFPQAYGPGALPLQAQLQPYAAR